MTFVYMNFDEVQNVSWRLRDAATLINNDLHPLKLTAKTLLTAVDDLEIVRLGEELQSILTRVEVEVKKVDDLSLRLNKELAKWETLDQDGRRLFTDAGTWDGMLTERDLIARPPAVSNVHPNAINARPTEIAHEPDSHLPPKNPTTDASLDEGVIEPMLDQNQIQDGLKSTSVAPDAEKSWGMRWERFEHIDQEIKDLERGSGKLSVAQEKHLDALYEQRQALRGELDEGIVDARMGNNYFDEGECTHYVATRRNVGLDLTGDARKWVDAAHESGWETGHIPVKGSIMVWQPGVHNASAAYGHVSHVENVYPNGDGSYTVEYTDNLNPNIDDPSHVVINPDDEGVDFIYERITSAA